MNDKVSHRRRELVLKDALLTADYSAKKLPEYFRYFVALFNDVHAFGYNFAESERIRMKFGELGVYCLELALTYF